MEEKKDYQDAYEKEHYKAVYLANRVAELEDQVDDLQFKLNRIKNNPIWKASGPARKCMHFVIRQKDRLKNCGSLSGVIAKVRYKSWEKKAMTHYGTQSFPSAEERQKQEAAVFERMPKISILGSVVEHAGKLFNRDDRLRPVADLQKLGAVSGGRFGRCARLCR